MYALTNISLIIYGPGYERAMKFVGHFFHYRTYKENIDCLFHDFFWNLMTVLNWPS